MFSDPKHNIEQLDLDPGMTVVDLGTGSGFYALEAAEVVGDTGKVYAVDVQKDLLGKLKSNASLKNLHNVEIIWGDIEKAGGTQVKDGFAHVAIVSNILFQIEDKKTFVKETKRILKQQGKVLVVDWTDSFGGIGPQKEHVVSEATTRKMFEEESFVFMRKIEAGEHHYGMIFKKA